MNHPLNPINKLPHSNNHTAPIDYLLSKAMDGYYTMEIFMAYQS